MYGMSRSDQVRVNEQLNNLCKTINDPTLLDDVSSLITEEEWAGAGLIISTETDRPHHTDDTFLVVENIKHALWVFYSIQEIFKECANTHSDYIFFTDFAKHIDKTKRNSSIKNTNVLLELVEAARKELDLKP